MDNEPTRILLVDNQVDAREWLAEWLRRSDHFEVDTAANSSQCLDKVRAAEGNYDVIVMDLFLDNGHDGIETMKEVKQLFPGIETIIITGFGGAQEGVRAMNEGAYRYVLKPFQKEELVVYIHHAAERRKLVAEVSRAKIYETFSALRMGLDLPRILDRMVDNLRELFNLSSCTIALLDPEKTRLEVVSEWGLGKKVVKFLADLPPDMDKVFADAEPLEITNLDERPDWKNALLRSDLKSFTLLPLNDTKGQPLGVITMGRLERTIRSPEEIRLLKGLADQAAIAIETIENERLHQETKNWAVLLETLDLASLDIADPIEVDEVLRKTIQGATNLLQASGGAIYLFRSTTEEEELEVRASYGEPHIDQGMVVNKNKGVVGRVRQTRKPFSKSSYSTWADRQEQFDHFKLTAVVGVPVTSGDRLLGVLAVHHNEEEKKFSVAQERILLSFGKHAGAALEKAQMLVERNKTDELIEALVAGLDNEQFLYGVLYLLREHFNYDYCAILLKDDSANELRLEATTFPPEDQSTPVKLRRGKGVTAWAALNGRTLIVPDVRKEKLYISALPGARSEIAVPIKVGGRVLGILNVESRNVSAFGERDDRILTRIAKAIAVHVDQAQHIEAAKHQMEESAFLGNFTSALNMADGLERKLRIVSSKMLEVSNADFGLIMTLTRGGQDLRVRAAHARSDAFNWNPRIGTTCSILAVPYLAEAVLGTSHKIIKRNELSGERLLKTISEHIELEEPLDSVLLVPLKEGAKVIGLCILGELAGHEGEVFTGRPIGSAVTIAEAASPLIQQAVALHLEHKRSTLLKHLTKVGSTVTATLKPDKVFNLIDEYSRTLLNAEVSTTFLVRRQGYLSLVSNSGSPKGTAEIGLELEITTGDKCGLTGYIAKMGEVFNEHGEKLTKHHAIKSKGPHPHLPSRYCGSLLAVPLKMQVGGREEVIGLLKVENKKDQDQKVDPAHGFHNDDVLVLKTLATFAVTAIQNAEHFDFAQALQRVAQVVHSSIIDYDRVLDRVLAELGHLIKFDTASIQLLAGDVLELKACEWLNERQKQDVMKLKFPLIPKFPNDHVMRTRTSMLIEDVRSSEYEHFWKEKMYCSSHIRSWMGVPLLFNDEAIGMLSIESNKPAFYTRAHIERAEAFANQVVSAIVNAALYKSAVSLIRLVEDITKQLEPATVLQKIANDAIDKDAIIGADKALIYEYDSDRGTFGSDAVHAGKLKKPELSNSLTHDSIVYRCTGLKKYHLAPDVERCSVLKGRFTAREKIVSAAVFPLLVDEQLVGLMFINYLKRHYFTEHEVRVMELFARHAAIAIQNARQHESLKKRMETATAMARVGRLASTWAHDVHTPTLVIRVDVATLRSEIEDSQSREILEEINDAANDIAQVIPSNLPLSYEPDSVDLSAVVRKIRQKRGKELRKTGVSLKTDLKEVPAVWANGQWLEWIFERMINNALRFLSGGGTITFSGRVSNRRVLLDIIDTGPGVPDFMRDQLYADKVNDPDSDGRGWSLLLIKSVLNDFNGDIDFPHKDERGNVFTIDLPLAMTSEVKSNGAQGKNPHRRR
jgi:GAF domain-containing protein/FixJ family two-component response regulator